MNKNNSFVSKFLGIIFLIWFFGSIFLMIYLSKINGYYTVMVFGQYFFVFGLIPLCGSKEKDKLIGIPFVLVGLCCIVIPYIMMNPDILSIDIIWDSVIPLLLIFAFVLAGLGMTFMPIINNKKLKKLCTLTVYAKILKYDYTYSDKGNKLYCPVYEFQFNNKKYEVSNNKYSNFGNKKIDTIVNLKVNPNNPEQFIDNTKFDMFVIVLGITFLVVSIPLFIYLITTLQFIN